MFGVKLNCDCEAANSGVVSGDTPVFFFLLGIFEELLWNVLWSSFFEEVFSEFPEASSHISSCRLRHDVAWC